MEEAAPECIWKKLLEEGVSASEVLTSKEIVLQIFDEMQEMEIEFAGRILFVMLNYVKCNADYFDEAEITQIFNIITTRQEFINLFQYSKAVADFIQFVSFLNYVPLETIMEFSNPIIENIQIESEQKYFAVSLISCLIQPLSAFGDTETINKYKDIVMSLLPTLSDDIFMKIVVESLIEIIDNGELEDTEFNNVLVTAIHETGNLALIKSFWYSLAFINEEKVEEILEIAIPLFFSTFGSEITGFIFFFIANNSQYIDFEQYVSQEGSLMKAMLDYNIGIESIEDYDDELFSKACKSAISCENELNLIVEFITSVLQADSLSDIQCIMCFTSVCTALDERGFLFISKLNFNIILDFIENNQEEFIHNNLILSSVHSFVNSITRYKEFIDREKTTQLFSFFFSNLGNADDESIYSEIYSLICDFPAISNDLLSEELISVIDESNIDVLTAVVKEAKSLSPQNAFELMQKFYEQAQSDESQIQSCYSAICSLYLHSYFVESCSSLFCEFTQAILSNLDPTNEANFVISFLSNLLFALCSTQTRPEFDLSTLDAFIEHSDELELFKYINEQIKRLEFLYSTETQKKIELFRNDPILMMSIVDSFPNEYPNIIKASSTDIWTDISRLNARGEVEDVAKFFRKMIKNGSRSCIPYALKFFVELPLQSDGCELRSAIILLPVFMELGIPSSIIGEMLEYVQEVFPICAPFAVSNNFLISAVEEESINEVEIYTSGALLAALEIGETPPPQEFIDLSIANIDKNKGFEVFLFSLYLRFPDAVPIEIIAHIIETFPQNQFASLIFPRLQHLLGQEEFDPNLKAEIIKTFLKLLLANDMTLTSLHIQRGDIESTIRQQDSGILESCLSQIPEFSEFLVALPSNQ